MIRRRKQQYQHSFDDLVRQFSKKLSNFNPSDNVISVRNYFGPGIGAKGSLHKLMEAGIVKNPNELKGLYIFFENGFPFYVGISGNVIRRIQQHLKGRSHYTSTLAFNLGKKLFRKKRKMEFAGTREEFPFEKYVRPMKTWLTDKDVAIILIRNDEELYLFEVYCAMELGTPLNSFRTH